jgi:DNA-binding PadR family transcriptional regulator
MDDVARHLPLSPQQFEILLALADSNRHGYGIILDVAERTGVRLGTGTLYTAIARLVDLSLIEETAAPRHTAARKDERRKYYRITSLGRLVLQAEAARLQTLVTHARQKGISPMARPAWSRLK